MRRCFPVGAETRWGMFAWLTKVRNAGWTLVGFLLLALPAAAQMEVGETNLTLNGNVGVAYSGANDQGNSSHGLGLVGNGYLAGSYYNPNFLNFTVQPFYNREQSDSVFGSLTNAGGVNSTVNLFNGSHFPASISFNKLTNSTGTYGIPGDEVGLAETGGTQNLGLSWSELLPGLPTFTASYSMSSGSTSILGTPGQDSLTDKTVNLLSTYTVRGFRMMGGFTHRNDDGSFVDVLGSGEATPMTSGNSSNSYTASVTHPLPMQGAFGVTWLHTAYDFDSEEPVSSSSSSSSDNLSGNVTLRPAPKLGVGINATYTDNLLGSVPQSIVNSGAVEVSNLGGFKSVLLAANGNYQLLRNLSVQGVVTHEDQKFFGQTYSATQFGGGANYNIEHPLWGGFDFYGSVFDVVNQNGNAGIGFVGGVNYTKKFDGWVVEANGTYSQNVQTQVLLYTTSGFSYLTNARRKLANRTYFMAGFSGMHSVVEESAGTSNSAERVSSAFTYRTYSLTGFYSKSEGTAVYTSTGLVTVPVGVPTSILSPSALTQYNSKSYGFSLGATPVRRLIISAAYAKSNGSTVDSTLTTLTNNNLFNFMMQYRLRKIYVSAGYTRLGQGLTGQGAAGTGATGTTGTSPLVVTSYYCGISRWFNFF